MTEGNQTYLSILKNIYGPVTHHNYDFTNPQQLREKSGEK